MKRRKFITLRGGVAARGARAAGDHASDWFSAQCDAPDVPHWVTAFRQGLKEAGFVEGQNVAIEYRSADNQPDRLPALVTDLIRQPVAVIVATLPAGIAGRFNDWRTHKPNF